MTCRADTELVVLHAPPARAVAIALIAWAIAGCSSSAAQAPKTTESGGSSGAAAGGATASQAGAGSGTLGGSAPANGGSLATGGGADGGGAGSLGGAGSVNGGAAGNDRQGGGASGVSESGATAGAAASGGAAAASGAGSIAGGAAGGASNGPLKAVMVVQGAGTPTAGDKVMVSRMTARGITTTFFSDSAVTAALVANMNLVVISSSAESGPLGAKLRDISIPVLCIENGEYPLMAMTGATLNTDYGQLTGVSQIQIDTTSSPLVGALSGTITISSTASDFGWGIPGAAALKGATVLSSANHFAIFGYEKGAQMLGLVAPARRAAFAIRETVAANLTSDGKQLFDSVLNWVLM